MICPCGAAAWKLAGRHEELSRTLARLVPVEYDACTRCGALVKLPLPSEAELKAYYQHAWQYQSERPHLERAVGFIVRGVRAPDGCGKFPLQAGPKMGEASFVGNGKLLEVAAKGDAFLKHFETFGVRFLGASLLDAQPQAECIDQVWLGSGEGPTGDNALVIAAHVLEHVPFPDLFLEDLLRLTAEDGYVYLEVPSLYGGQWDIGLCDDINRNHLWHFTLASLVALGTRFATVVLVEDDVTLPGWPVLRLLLRKRPAVQSAIEAFSLVSRDVACEYEKAELALYGRSPEGTALYAASHSYALLSKLWKGSQRRFQVYDRYKNGESWNGLIVRHPDTLVADGIRELFVTTRSFNSYVDIKRALYESHPWIAVHSLYPNIRQAVGEEDPAPVSVVA